MSSYTQQRIQSVQRDLERLHQKQSDSMRDEARIAERIARLMQDLGRSSSISQMQSKQREIDRLRQDAVRLQSKRADAARDISRKTGDLHRYQQQYSREQSKEHDNAFARLRRDYDVLRSRQHEQVQGAIRNLPEQSTEAFDAFISHATEDKEEIVRPLAEKLIAAGFRIWFDELQLRVGDSLRRSIDRGLASSRFGIIVLSPSFFAKNWPQYELDGLVAREMQGGKVILPLWHKVSKNEVIAFSPSLADKLALNTAMYSLDELVAELSTVLRDAG